MQTGHMLNLNRRVSLTDELLGLAIVIIIVIPVLIVVGIIAAVISIFK